MVKHRMTAKARGALQIMFEISGENPAWLKSDHQTVYAAYGELESVGYQWVTEKQSWAYIARPAAKRVQYICISCPLETMETAAKMIEDGAFLNDITLGEVTKIDIVTETGEVGVMLYIEVRS